MSQQVFYVLVYGIAFLAAGIAIALFHIPATQAVGIASAVVSFVLGHASGLFTPVPSQKSDVPTQQGTTTS